MKSYTHFTLEERESLYLLLKLNKSITEIAKELGRSKSSISRELKRNSNKITNQYNPWGAYSLYRKRRKKCCRKARIKKGSELYEYICDKLKKYWSPEIIATKWNKTHPDDHIAFTTIYFAIKRGLFDDISVKTHLRRRGKKKYGGRSKFNTIHPEYTIHDRPDIANSRLRFGDWEGDTIRGAVGTGCLVTFVERKSRKLLCVKAPNMSAKAIYHATCKAFAKIRPLTLCLDNGSEFALFNEIETALKTTIYFADPHSPWQRGSNENINGAIRFFFPKGTDFRKVSDKDIKHVVNLLNSRPRRCLDYLSPDEVFCCT